MNGLDKLDEMIELAISNHRYELATGMLLALVQIAEDDLNAETKQKFGEKLIELQLSYYNHISSGTNDILTLAGFDENTVKEILTNAQAKSTEGKSN